MTELAAPPADKIAEQSVIGIAMWSPNNDRLAGVRAEDFYWPTHRVIWQTIMNLRSAQQPVHPTTVQSELARTRNLSQVSDALIECTSRQEPAETAAHFAAIVRDLAAHRSLIDIGRRLIQRAEGSESPATVIAALEADVHRVPVAEAADSTSSLLNLDEFLDQKIGEDDWVIPGRLARGERLIITGSEGAGKSTLSRQIAVCAAAGMDPFDATECPPQRVLLIDVENPLPIMHRRFASLRSAVTAHGATIDPKNLWIDRRPEGLDLGKPGDRLWLQRRVLATNPALIVIGPVYKLYVGGAQSREEDLARQVTAVLDQIKTDVNAALVLEHHAPHQQAGASTRDLRPIGSSLWLRWPEFGFGLKRVRTESPDRLVEIKPWRGDRDVRSWPHRLRSESATNGMPWVETTPED